MLIVGEIQPIDLTIELLRGREAINRVGLCSAISALQFSNTQTPDDIAKAKASGKPSMGMGGAESVHEVITFLKGADRKVLALTIEDEIIGFHTFCSGLLTTDFYKHYLDNQSLFPEDLQGLTREQIAFGGTVVMERQFGDNIELPTGHYRFTHAIMIANQIIAGNELVVDWCFAGNAALEAHKKQGYKVLLGPDNQPLKFKSNYNTLTEEGGELVIIYCKTHSEQQKANMHEALAALQKDDPLPRSGNVFNREPEREIIDLLRQAIKLSDNSVPIP